MRTILAKSEKDKLKNTSNTLEEVKDINKFKKHIQQVFDRLSKGGGATFAQNSEDNG